MRRIGHRGAMGHAPENTVASFEKAIALGCDEVETDVWLTADGRLVISHDPPPVEASLTLDSVLDLCRGRVGVNVELKCKGDEARAAATGTHVARRLAERADPDAYVSSFWWAALAAARGAAPAVRRAFVFSDSPDRAALIASARSLGLWALHPDRAYVTRELVDAAHAAGLRVNAWTVNDQDEIAALAALGVDGIMSNWPERVPKG
jgi:glycerophosphoryl diester phosphodiesterase